MTGPELREQREALGLSLVKLGRELGVHYMTVWRWEQGKMAIRHPAMVQMALDRLRERQEGASYS